MIPRITNDNKLINTIKSQFVGDGRVLPNFLNNEIISHRICYTGFQKIVQLLLILFHPTRVLKQTHIRTIELEIEEILDECGTENIEVTLLYNEYMNKMLNAYLQLCIVNEIYESAENIKNMLKKLNNQ